MLSGVGGRGNANRWEISDLRLLAGEPGRPSASRRVPPPAGARPLVAPVVARVSSTSHESPPSFDLGSVHAAGKGGQDQTLSVENCPVLTGVSGAKGGHDQTLSPENCPILTGVSGVKGGQDQTLFAGTPAERAAKNPGTDRARGEGTPEPRNQRTTPLKGGGRTTRARSRRPTQPTAAENATAGSTSTSMRSAARSAYRQRVTTPTGSGFASCWSNLSARALSRFGSSPSS